MSPRIRVVLALGLSFLAANALAAVGRTVGQFAVGPMGDAQYSVPIWAPPGPRGIGPNISLVYDHRSAIGPLGIGWSIAGLGSITRCNKTVAQDTTAAPVALQVSDGYCINGNRLRLTAGTYGTAGSTYQTEIADFSNITANGTAGNGPAYFTVQGRDGLTYQYGYTDANGNGANSEVVATGTSTASSWMLSKVIDRSQNQNNYAVNYMTLNGAAIPTKIVWTPTAAGASTYTYSMVFNYTNNLPQSSINKYVGGTLVSNTELLSSITIYNGSAVIRDYFLSYQVSPSTGRNELNTIIECADSAQSNCLLPTTITYDTGTAGVSTTATSALSSSGANLTARYDLNGDGYPDLVYEASSGSAWYVAFGSASGYGSPVNVGINASVHGNVLIGRLTGGSADAILANNGGTWYSYVWNGSTFVTTSTGIAYDIATYGYQLADINGDGLPDLVDLDVVENPTTKKSTATIYTQLNTSTATTVRFSSTVSTAYTLGGLASAQLETPDFQYGNLRSYDFNGDGLGDLVLLTISGTSPNFTLSTYELLANGTSFTQAVIASTPGSTYTPVFFTNWNDDKCTDFVSSTTLYVSGCDGSVPQTQSVGTIVAAMDWDGDGRTDLVVANGSTLGVYLSTGAGISSLVTTTLPYTSTCQYVTMDANGDGLDDLGCWSQSGALPITYYLHNGITDLAASFTDGLGNSVSPTYTSISQQSNYFQWNNLTFPYENYLGPLYVVNGATFSDPSGAAGATYFQDYFYAGASLNLQGRGFSGFGAMEQYDSRSGIWYTRNYGQTFPYVGLLVNELADTANLSSQSIYSATYTATAETLSSTANEQRYFAYISSSTRNDYEVGSKIGTLITTTSTNSGTPDAYGNFDSITTTVTDEDSGSPYYGNTWISTVANTIAPNVADWCLNLPTQTTVTNSGTGVPAAITRTVSYTPDYAHCWQTAKITESNSATYKVTEAYGFDNFGNINSIGVTGVGMPMRNTGITWNATGQFPMTIQNPLGQSVNVLYDPNTGMLSSQTDPNTLVTTWTYDGFGRKIQENRPDKTYTVWQYNDCASDGGCLFGAHAIARSYYIYNVGGSILNDGTTYFDTVDRTVMSNGEALSGYNRTDLRYDPLGRVAKQSMPCTYTAVATPCSYWNAFAYDTRNRVTQSQRPISATHSTLQTTQIAYSGRTTTTTDALGNSTTKINYVTGQMAQSKDAKGYSQTFTYDAFGSLLKSVDSASNTLFTRSYAYGIAAFPTATTDMDMGSWSNTTVDALGEITKYTDAKGQSFTQTYDGLSRPLVRTEPDLTTTWTWGNTAASYNIGKLQSVTAASSVGSYVESWAYDTLARLSTDTRTLPGDTTYTYTYTYNSTTGLLNTLQYPVSTSYQLGLQYGYTNGILSSLTDTQIGTVYWTANTENARGQVTQETLGNGAVINRTFDAVTGWVGSMQAGVGGGSSLRNLGYLFDEMGNLIQRQENNEGLTENFYYDADYRLDHSQLNGALNLQMTYDTAGMGNIASRSDVAGGSAWTYDSVRKHAVTLAGTGGYNFTYDANGNATSRNGYTVTWTSYNYPSGVNSLGESATFQYGWDRQRWQTIYTGSIGTETTYHVGKLLEKVANGGVLDYRHYIYAGNELVGIYSRQTNGTNTLHYVLEDHQSSFSAIVTDSTPGPVSDLVWESFTPYGTRRNGPTWAGTPTSGDETNINSVSRRGFTGETVLGVSMGLNHLNGRIEDSLTGRFLSPDPYIPDPSNTQSFNRYSYVNNNPLSFNDPTGFDGCSDGGYGDCTTGGDGGNGGNGSVPEIVVTSTAPGPVTTENPSLPLGQLPIGSALEGAGTAFNLPPALTNVTQKPIPADGSPDQIPGVEVDAQANSPWNDADFTNINQPLFFTPGGGAAAGRVLNILTDVLCQNTLRETVSGAAAGMAGAGAISNGNRYAILAGGAFGAYLGAVGSKNSAVLSAIAGAAFGVFDPLAEGLTLSFGPALTGGAANFIGTAAGGGTFGAAATAGTVGAGTYIVSGGGSIFSGPGITAVALPATVAAAAYAATTRLFSAACDGQ